MMRVYANGQVAEMRCDMCGKQVTKLWRTWQDYPEWGEATERREIWACERCRAVAARTLFKRGASDAEVANRFNVSVGTVRRWRQDYA